MHAFWFRRNDFHFGWIGAPRRLFNAIACFSSLCLSLFRLVSRSLYHRVRKHIKFRCNFNVNHIIIVNLKESLSKDEWRVEIERRLGSRHDLPEMGWVKCKWGISLSKSDIVCEIENSHTVSVSIRAVPYRCSSIAITVGTFPETNAPKSSSVPRP